MVIFNLLKSLSEAQARLFLRASSPASSAEPAGSGKTTPRTQGPDSAPHASSGLTLGHVESSARHVGTDPPNQAITTMAENVTALTALVDRVRAQQVAHEKALAHQAATIAFLTATVDDMRGKMGTLFHAQATTIGLVRDADEGAKALAATLVNVGAALSSGYRFGTRSVLETEPIGLQLSPEPTTDFTLGTGSTAPASRVGSLNLSKKQLGKRPAHPVAGRRSGSGTDLSHTHQQFAALIDGLSMGQTELTHTLQAMRTTLDDHTTAITALSARFEETRMHDHTPQGLNALAVEMAKETYRAHHRYLEKLHAEASHLRHRRISSKGREKDIEITETQHRLSAIMKELDVLQATPAREGESEPPRASRRSTRESQR